MARCSIRRRRRSRCRRRAPAAPPSGGAVLEILRPHPDSPGLWQRVHWRVRPDGLWRASGAASARGRRAAGRRRRAACCRRQQHDAARLDSRHGWAEAARARRPPPRPASKSPCSARRAGLTLFARDGAAMIRPIAPPPARSARRRRDQRAHHRRHRGGADYQPVPAPDRQRAPAGERAVAPAGRMLLAGGIDWRAVVRDHGKREAVTRRTRSGPPHPGHAHRASRRRARGRVLRRAGGRTGQVQPVQPGAARAAAGRGTGAAALLGLLRLPDTLAPRIIDIVARSRRRSPPKPSRVPRPPAAPPRGVQELGAALGLDPAVRDELQRTMTLLPANTQVNVNTARLKSSPRWHPACRSARPAPSPASATGAMPSTIAATSPTAWRAPASRARRRHRQRLVHGARRGGYERPSHRAGAAARHARRRARDRLDERRQLKNTLRIALPLGDAGRGQAAALCLVRPARPLRAPGAS